MDDKRKERSETDRPAMGEQSLNWQDGEAYVARRQEAIDEGRNPDEVKGGPSCEEVQAFVAAEEARKQQTNGKAGKEKKESLFSFTRKDDEEMDLEERRPIVADMLPGGNLKPLYESEHCLLCSRPQPYPRELYAITDLGHKEPEGRKTSAIGLRVKTKVGSLVALQIASCKHCRKNYRIASNLRLFLMILLIAGSVMLLSLGPIAAALTSVHPMLPVILFLLMIPLSWLIGTLARNAFMRSKQSETHFDIEEIPFVQQLVYKGWFQLYGKQPVSRLIFSKERLKGNWFTQ